ncbi:hypothetical protein AHIS2_p017 [Acaryochloris phage A-HIS2]|nr:hypothetical protein AHIS2_p017 [Acaryochloris phage A-HIS2]
MIEILEQTSESYRFYLALRYGINPWGLYFKFGEIAELLGIQKQDLTKIVNRGNKMLSSVKAKRILEKTTGLTLVPADVAKRSREEHQKKLDILAGNR